MKKLLVITTFSLMSSLAFADKPLLIQQGAPVPLNNNETPVAETYYKPLQPVRYKNEQALNGSLMLEYSAQKGKFANNIDADIDGFGIGFSSSPHKKGFWGCCACCCTGRGSSASHASMMLCNTLLCF